jgi:DnaJ-class molecular chaperone
MPLRGRSAGLTPGADKSSPPSRAAAAIADERDMLANLTFVECAECFGTGMVGDGPGAHCPACEGEGATSEWSYQ